GCGGPPQGAFPGPHRPRPRPRAPPLGLDPPRWRPPATSATEDLRELRWARSVVTSTYLAPTSAVHPTTARLNSSQQRRARPGLPTLPRHGGIAGSQHQGRTITPRAGVPGETAPGALLVLVPGPEDALPEPTLAARRRVEPPWDLDVAAFLARGNDHRD